MGVMVYCGDFTYLFLLLLLDLSSPEDLLSIDFLERLEGMDRGKHRCEKGTPIG